jgi:hypothetical protein
MSKTQSSGSSGSPGSPGSQDPTVVKERDSDNGCRNFEVDPGKGATIEAAHLRLGTYKVEAPITVASDDNGKWLLTVDCSSLSTPGNYHLCFGERDAEGTLLREHRHHFDHETNTLAPSATPESAEMTRKKRPPSSRPVSIAVKPFPAIAGQLARITVSGDDCQPADPVFTLTAEALGDGCCTPLELLSSTVNGTTSYSLSIPPGQGLQTLRVTAYVDDEEPLSRDFEIAQAKRNGKRGPLDGPAATDATVVSRGSISLRRVERPPTTNQDFYTVIRSSTNAMGFPSYQRFLDAVFGGDNVDTRDGATEAPAARGLDGGTAGAASRKLSASRLALPFPGVNPYRTLKAATEVFLLLNSGAVVEGGGPGSPLAFIAPGHPTLEEEESRMGHPITGRFRNRVNKYLVPLGPEAEDGRTLPYLDLIRSRLTGNDIVETLGGDTFDYAGILRSKLTRPLLIELIWSYWMEEGMLAQTMNAISLRFQNRQVGSERDPLAQLEVDPLRPFSNFMWGYVQDETHRLSVFRRAHEYAHHYGLGLQGKAVRDLRASDVRSKFLEAFHHLLHQCVLFFRADDDTTIYADGFPVLNALKETHYVLAQGAHNQFGDLPATARQEMLVEQWMLSRPEVREFLGGRIMVPYPEDWMDRVDTVKTLKGWTDVSVVHFRDLAVYGEEILLSVRLDRWSDQNDPEYAANWCRYWRPEIQAYVHAYRATTGIDLSADVTHQSQLSERFLPPSVHLSRRLAAQSQKRG